MTESIPVEPTPEELEMANTLPLCKQSPGEAPVFATPGQLTALEKEVRDEIFNQFQTVDAARAEVSKKAISRERLTASESKKIDEIWGIFLSVKDVKKFLTLLSPEQLEIYASPKYAKMFDDEALERLHPDWFHVVLEKHESGPEIVEFERLVDVFEQDHSLEALHAIDYLDPVMESPVFLVRQAAKTALEPICQLLARLTKETDISSEKYQELNAKYTRLTQAVGIINNGRVDHTRVSVARKLYIL